MSIITNNNSSNTIPTPALNDFFSVDYKTLDKPENKFFVVSCCGAQGFCFSNLVKVFSSYRKACDFAFEKVVKFYAPSLDLMRKEIEKGECAFIEKEEDNYSYFYMAMEEVEVDIFIHGIRKEDID